MTRKEKKLTGIFVAFNIHYFKFAHNLSAKSINAFTFNNERPESIAI